MNSQERIIQHKLKVLRHAEQIWNVAKTCRYFGIGRASLYRWKAAYEARSFSEWFDEQLRELCDGLDRMDAEEVRVRSEVQNPHEHSQTMLNAQRHDNTDRWIGELSTLVKHPHWYEDASAGDRGSRSCLQMGPAASQVFLVAAVAVDRNLSSPWRH